MRVDAICITTNGCVKLDGTGVMGRGVAAEAKRRWPGIERNLGYWNKKVHHSPWAVFQPRSVLLTSAVLSSRGYDIFLPNTPHSMMPYHIISFITKPGNNADKCHVLPHYEAKFMDEEHVPGWACKSSLQLIKQAASDVVTIANRMQFESVALPMPGCGNGGLTWERVKPMLASLDNRFLVVSI